MSSVQQVVTGDGCHSLYVPQLDEHYHSTHGAFNEAMHVFINNGFNETQYDLSVLEIGFGTGLNAWLTAIAANQSKRKVCYTSFETRPLNNTILSSLNYAKFSNQEKAAHWLKNIHQCDWNEYQVINEFFDLKKVHQSVFEMKEKGTFDLIYFDAFGPRKQPEMWTIEVFSLMFDSLKAGGSLVTYCAQGQVKRNMKSVGFEVVPLPGPPGKREMTKAIKV